MIRRVVRLAGWRRNPENAYRNGTMYSSYTAESFARILDTAARYGVNLAGATSWSFEFEGQKWFDGFRDLATNGVDKPVLNIFRMYGMMRGRRVSVDDGSVMAAADGHGMTVMLWNYTDDDLPGEVVGREVSLRHLPVKHVRVTEYRVDEEHGNAYTVWKTMGLPQEVGPAEYKKLESSGRLAG
ncbi:hypothetical protein ACQ86N_32560 [Puia sp. P3]|uniref:hypothetical protein n=1 Tax=Puia sp. P3 TaxID=3423952 RepID=UPI003D66FED4